jgi:putative ABC transport system permease protein
VVAIVEREPQAEQLRALRVQGLSRRVAVTSAYAGVAALVAAGLLAGLLAAVLARPIAAVTAPPFPDHWRLIPPPDPLGPAALGLAAAVAAVALAIAAVIAVRPLVHRLLGTVR